VVARGRRGLGSDLPRSICLCTGGPYRGSVEKKTLRVVEWYRAEVDLREQGMEPLLTASELWNDFRRVRMAS
jgi:hypothetical protein